eukprot:scaffold49914_cov33-Phaeocystis_antarctica.AAC.1
MQRAHLPARMPHPYVERLPSMARSERGGGPHVACLNPNPNPNPAPTPSPNQTPTQTPTLPYPYPSPSPGGRDVARVQGQRDHQAVPHDRARSQPQRPALLPHHHAAGRR